MKRELSLDELKAIQLEILETVVALCNGSGLRYYLAYGTLLGAVRHGGFIPWDDDIDIIMPRPDYDRFVDLCRDRLPSHYEFVDFRTNWRLAYNFGKVIDKRTVLIPEVRPGWEYELGVNVDVFPLDGSPSRPWLRNWHFWKSWLLQRLLNAATADTSRTHRGRLKRTLIGVAQAFMPKAVVVRCHHWMEAVARRYPYDDSEMVCCYVSDTKVTEFIPREWLGEGTPVRFESKTFIAPSEYDKYLTAIYGDYMQPPPPAERRSHHRYRAYKL